jgi:hypothetical protein
MDKEARDLDEDWLDKDWLDEDEGLPRPSIAVMKREEMEEEGGIDDANALGNDGELELDGEDPSSSSGSSSRGDEGEFFPGYGSNGNGKVAAAAVHYDREPPSPRTHILRAFKAGNGALTKPQFKAIMCDLGHRLEEEQENAIDKLADDQGRYAMILQVIPVHAHVGGAGRVSCKLTCACVCVGVWLGLAQRSAIGYRTVAGPARGGRRRRRALRVGRSV